MKRGNNERASKIVSEHEREKIQEQKKEEDKKRITDTSGKTIISRFFLNTNKYAEMDANSINTLSKSDEGFGKYLKNNKISWSDNSKTRKKYIAWKLGIESGIFNEMNRLRAYMQ
jgi:hypothetical protein